MLDRTEIDPVFFAPFVSSIMTVEPGWLDYNGHLNMAWYNVLFDRAMDEAFLLVGLGPEHVLRNRSSYFIAEAHLRYLRELNAGDQVRVTLHLVALDDKRMHIFEQLFHATEGWMSATSETMALHVDMASKKVTPWPLDIRRRLDKMRAAHAHLPTPEATGSAIAMRGG